MKNCYYYFVFCCSLLLALLADASAHEQHQVTGNNKNDGAILTDHEDVGRSAGSLGGIPSVYEINCV